MCLRLLNVPLDSLKSFMLAHLEHTALFCGIEKYIAWSSKDSSQRPHTNRLGASPNSDSSLSSNIDFNCSTFRVPLDM